MSWRLRACGRVRGRMWGEKRRQRGRMRLSFIGLCVSVEDTVRYPNPHAVDGQKRTRSAESRICRDLS